jgi:hypothetical protein
MRSFTSTVSMSWAFSSTGASRLAATRSASAPGAWMESMSELGLARELRHELDDLLRDVAQAHRERLGLDVLVDGLVRRTILALRYGAVCVTVSRRCA